MLRWLLDSVPLDVSGRYGQYLVFILLGRVANQGLGVIIVRTVQSQFSPPNARTIQNVFHWKRSFSHIYVFVKFSSPGQGVHYGPTLSSDNAAKIPNLYQHHPIIIVINYRRNVVMEALRLIVLPLLLSKSRANILTGDQCRSSSWRWWRGGWRWQWQWWPCRSQSWWWWWLWRWRGWCWWYSFV